MKILYDLHIHSALSPCADDTMTPVNVVVRADMLGLNVIAVSDHNAIKNVQAAMEIGEALGVTVIPAMEVQTSEDIHVLTLFYDYESLVAFDGQLHKTERKNVEDIFGHQYIVDSDDNVVGKEESLLLTGVGENIYDIFRMVKSLGGVPVPAHIDREENGILPVLGELPVDLGIEIVEFSALATEKFKNCYAGYRTIADSDAHYIDRIGSAHGEITAKSNSVRDVLDAIQGKGDTENA